MQIIDHTQHKYLLKINFYPKLDLRLPWLDTSHYTVHHSLIVHLEVWAPKQNVTLCACAHLTKNLLVKRFVVALGESVKRQAYYGAKIGSPKSK